VFIVHYNVNSDAPFQLNVSEHITSKARNTFTASSLLKWIQDINPDLLICSGWTDREYITAVRRWNNPQRCVLTMDTVWNGHPRQWLACVISRFTICRWFSKLWVPGELQKKYAQKLGFTTIATGFYCCRHTLFLPLAQKRFINSKKNKKILLYVGKVRCPKRHFPFMECVYRFTSSGRSKLGIMVCRNRPGLSFTTSRGKTFLDLFSPNAF